MPWIELLIILDFYEAALFMLEKCFLHKFESDAKFVVKCIQTFSYHAYSIGHIHKLCRFIGWSNSSFVNFLADRFGGYGEEISIERCIVDTHFQIGIQEVGQSSNFWRC